MHSPPTIKHFGQMIHIWGVYNWFELVHTLFTKQKTKHTEL